MTDPNRSTVDKVKTRDWGACARCGRYVLNGQRGRDWSVHHRRPRGSGGTSLGWVNLPGNLILLCGSGVDGCHGHIESNRDEARAQGFLVNLNGKDVPSMVPVVHAVHGVVLLDDAGGIELVKGDGYAY